MGDTANSFDHTHVPHSHTVRLIQCQMEIDHFQGLDRALAERGMPSERVFPEQPPLAMGPGTKAVVISDVQAGMNGLAYRQARRVGAGVVLMMDGIVEYRNTFVNRRVSGGFVVGEDGRGAFLRPAPADIVACCGEIDRRLLTAMGNRAAATGLPRLNSLRAATPLAVDRRAVLVATANQPWFTDEERERLLAALRQLKETLQSMNVEPVWRLRGELDDILGVTSDRRPLRQVLAEVPAVLTTASTLLVESMLAGRATAILHPHTSALWQPAAWGWRGGTAPTDEPDLSAAEGLDAAALRELRQIHDEAHAATAWFDDPNTMIESLLARDAGMIVRQSECLSRLCADAAPHGASSADRVAKLIGAVVAGDIRPLPEAPAFPTPVRQPARRPASGRPCVVSCVVCDDTPVGGVLTWSRRLGAEFAQRDLGYDVRTLMICAAPDVWRWKGVRVELDANTDLCVIDPLADHTETVSRVRDAVERLAGGTPSIIIPNYTDITHAVAMQLRARGTRTITVAHTDETYYQELISTYHKWDGAVAVSSVCMEWLRRIESDTRGNHSVRRWLECIPCAAPVASAPRTVSSDGPLRLAYVGRMVQVQKRISDLLHLIDGLEARAVAYELHMVGDGVDLPGWRADLARRTLRHGKVIVHGLRDAAWVASFMPSIDVSVLVSEFEGTSVSMLEAMGAGVVPAVTAVRSGVDEWVKDGENGVIVPVGQPDVMAERLAVLAHDRRTLARMSRAAWEKASRDGSVRRMADRYRDLFDGVRSAPLDAAPTDLGVRLLERWRWSKDFAENPAQTRAQTEAMLREAGYRRISYDVPEPGCDAVVVRVEERPLSRVQAEQISFWRECGLGVVALPHLRMGSPEDVMSTESSRACARCRSLVRRAVQDGARRIAVYGTGKHTRRLAPLFDGLEPFVGFIDDRPPAWEYMFGLPIVELTRAAEMLKMDAVLLSSDAWEAQMWERTEPLRRVGVRVIRVYTTDEIDAAVASAA